MSMSTEQNEPEPRGAGENNPEVNNPEEVQNPEVAYDRTDMDPKAIVGFMIALAIAGIFMHLILWSVFKYYAGPAKTPAAGPIMTSTREIPKGDPERTFPAPRLQADDVADLNKFREREEDILRSYGWVDQSRGVARIPVEQAIQALAKQGLPTRPPMPDNAATESAQAPAPGSGGAVTKFQAGEVPGKQ